MVFKNIRLFFLGSDDFPKKAEMLAAQDLNPALEAGGQVSRLPNKFHFQKLLGLMSFQNFRCGAGDLLSFREPGPHLEIMDE